MLRRILSIGAMALVAAGTCCFSPPPARAQFVNTTAGSGMTYGFPFACDKSVPINISAAGTTQVVAAVTNLPIYVCAITVSITGTTPTIQFEYGTGTNCGTGTTVLTGAMAPTSGSLLMHGNGVGTLFRTPATNALCIVAGGTGPSIQGVLTYAE